MKPTEQEKQWLKEYLYQTMEYRETYEEVYDHMLLAIENAPEQEFFESVVLQIIEKDFGGSNGLLELEANCRQAVEVTAAAQFRNNFMRWFKSPLVVITATMFMALFYLQLPDVKTHGALLLLFVALLILPTIICSIRATQLGYKYGENKTSIKDEVFRKLAFASGRGLLKLVFTLKFVEMITKFLFMLNHTIGMIIGSLLILLLIIPAIKRFSLKHIYDDDFKVVSFRRSLIYWRLFIVLLSTELIRKYLFKIDRWPIGKSISLNVIYGIVATVMVLMIINVFVVIKLYRSEFKTQMIA
jgi:hypothetical protein